MVITSIDFAKRDDVRDDLLRAEWDLVVIDEAHKCAAYTGSDDGAVKTKRYTLAEGLASRTERLLLMTATPHSGDEDRFRWFLGLLDPDQFSSPDLVKRQIAQEGNPSSSADKRKTSSTSTVMSCLCHGTSRLSRSNFLRPRRSCTTRSPATSTSTSVRLRAVDADPRSR